jgi:hypothetical protein
MGDILSSELVKVIYALLPGFITAWIFYGLTAHRRLSPFERTVQALIFTGIIQAILLVLRGFLLLLGKLYSFGEWNENISFLIAIILAILIGLVFSLFANKDWFHKFLRGEYKWSKCFNKFGGITKRTSYPSEWFSAFNEGQRYIVLHLKGNRRLLGWPYEWPDHPDAGHFVIQEPQWLLDDGKIITLDTVQKMLIPAKDVERVEFILFASEKPELS